MTPATLTGTRAVFVRYTPDVERCEACPNEIVGRNGRRPAICCNVHENGRWVRREFFHIACYDLRYGPVIDRGRLPAKSRTGWTFA